MEAITGFFCSQSKRVWTLLLRIQAFAPTVPDDIESGVISNHHPDHPEFSAVVLGFCFASALGLLILYLEFHNSNRKEIPLSLHLFALFMSCSFATIFVAQFIASNIAKVLRRVGYAFAAAAFFLAITVPSPLWLKIIYCLIVLIGSFIVFKYGRE